VTELRAMIVVLGGLKPLPLDSIEATDLTGRGKKVQIQHKNKYSEMSASCSA